VRRARRGGVAPRLRRERLGRRGRVRAADAELAARRAHGRAAATLALFRGLDDAALVRHAVANGAPVTARSLAWITAGHERHHRALLAERYLPTA
jgi:hypothetical protein